MDKKEKEFKEKYDIDIKRFREEMGLDEIQYGKKPDTKIILITLVTSFFAGIFFNLGFLGVCLGLGIGFAVVEKSAKNYKNKHLYIAVMYILAFIFAGSIILLLK